MTPRTMAWVLGLAASAAAGTLAACKEGEGSRCQIDADCRGDLICNKATETCQNAADIDPDASFEPDAMVVQDAPAQDAATDAAADASSDAASDAPSDPR